MGLLQFFTHMMDDETFRTAYLSAKTTAERVVILRKYNLSPTQVGLVLCENKYGLVPELSTSIAELDSILGGVDNVKWPGPMAVSAETLTPSQGPVGKDCSVEVRGWHFSQRVSFELAQGETQVKVSPSWVHVEPSGQSWAGIVVNLPTKGMWSIAVRNPVGEYPVNDGNLSTTLLPDAFEAM
jgi:hypothetical protein